MPFASGQARNTVKGPRAQPPLLVAGQECTVLLSRHIAPVIHRQHVAAFWLLCIPVLHKEVAPEGVCAIACMVAPCHFEHRRDSDFNRSWLEGAGVLPCPGSPESSADCPGRRCAAPGTRPGCGGACRAGAHAGRTQHRLHDKVRCHAQCITRCSTALSGRTAHADPSVTNHTGQASRSALNAFQHPARLLCTNASAA